jgi:putative hydrolase of the HAD superfamily
MTLKLKSDTPSDSRTEEIFLTPPDAAIWQTLRREAKAISLDLWGTLLDDKHTPADTVLYSEQRQNYLRETLQRHGYIIHAERMKAAYKHAWVYFDELWMRQQAFGAAEGLSEILRVLRAELPSSEFWRVTQFFEEKLGADAPPELDNAATAVKKLAARYPLALISDTAWTPGRVLRQVLDHYGILTCFRALIFSGEVGVTKPHPRMFQLALDGLGVKPHECLHVGDLQRTDIAGAKAAGLHTAWICRQVYAGKLQENAGPEAIVKSVSELAERLLFIPTSNSKY